MANRYWVGGNGTWNSTNVTNWSNTSGGIGGASVPTLNDSVFFDDASSASDALAVTVVGGVSCSSFTNSRSSPKNLTLSTDTSGSISSYGTSITLGSTSVLTTYFGWLNVYGNGSTLSSLATTVVFPKIFFGSNITSTMQFTVNSSMSEVKVSPDSTVIVKNTAYVDYLTGMNLSQSSTSRPEVRIGALGSTTTKLYITGSINCISGPVFINPIFPDNALYIQPSGGSASLNLGQININSRTVSANIVRLTLKPLFNGNTFTFSGNYSITTLEKYPDSISFTMKFTPSNYTQSFENFNVNGDSSATVYIESYVPGVRAKITKSGGGTVSTNYVQVTDMQPYPDNTWISYNSTNAGNNYQWYFNNFIKPTSCLFFGGNA